MCDIVCCYVCEHCTVHSLLREAVKQYACCACLSSLISLLFSLSLLLSSLMVTMIMLVLLLLVLQFLLKLRQNDDCSYPYLAWSTQASKHVHSRATTPLTSSCAVCCRRTLPDVHIPPIKESIVPRVHAHEGAADRGRASSRRRSRGRSRGRWLVLRRACPPTLASESLVYPPISVPLPRSPRPSPPPTPAS